MTPRVTVEDHGNFHADVRRRLAPGTMDPAEIVNEDQAEMIEHLPRRRSTREAGRLLSILDELEKERRLA